VLAIRGAMGDTDTYCPASSTGKILQRWILNNLLNSQRIAAVSSTSLKQLVALANSPDSNKRWQVILNGFNDDFEPIQPDVANQKLRSLGIDTSQRFILHVGSNLARKNRSMLVKMIAALGKRWDGTVCFAGQPMAPGLIAEAESLGIMDRVIGVHSPDHDTLLALYSRCEAFVFPSYSEGFGWPLIEAQACGAPVIASNIDPMPEVCGGAAIHASPNDVHQFADALLRLQDVDLRDSLIQRGFENCKRFDVATMINRYRDLICG
jgi:glycosyltransferase involved in cell wall biosynthesis